MTTEHIQWKLAEIRDTSDDAETAHVLEHALRAAFIDHVAALKIPELSEKAKLVLSSTEIKFPRW